MSNERPPLPTGEFVKSQFKLVRPLLGIFGLFSGNLRNQLKELDKQLADIERMQEDRKEFAKRFGPLGWTIYDRLSTEVVHDVVREVDDEKAEAALIAYHLDPDQLQFLGYRFNSSRYDAWKTIYERAQERVLCVDFISAVPLVLIIVDGICTTKSGKHPFSGGADAPVFDSETSAPGGLAEGLAKLGATRRRLDTDPIDSPYRHGIFHGLNPNFGSAIVAAKAINLLQAMVDYFDRREDEEGRISRAVKDQKQPSWSELAATLKASQDLKRRIDEWEARPPTSGMEIAVSGRSHNLTADSPEAGAATYLDAIISRNFGLLAKLTIDFPLRTIGYRAGRHRDDIGDIKLASWQITGVRDEAPAISEIDAALQGTYGETQWAAELTMRLIFGDEKFETRARGTPGCNWAALPSFLSGLLPAALVSVRNREGGGES